MAVSITYNNADSGECSNFITFTDIPNILKVTDTNGGQKAEFQLQFSGNLHSATLPSGDTFWYISLLGDTVTSTDTYSNAFNKNFYPATDAISTAASVSKALRSCPNVTANFTVEHSGSTVIVKGRDVGHATFNYTTNIPNDYLEGYITNQGGAASELYNSKVNVDLFEDNNYVTTLEKNYYGSEVAFDLSPVLTTLAVVGETKPYSFKVSYMNESGYTSLGTIGTNYIAQGFMCNQGNKFLQLSAFQLAANYNRGDTKTTDNNTTLYVYGNTIPLSVYMSDHSTQVTVNIHYLNSAYEEITASTYTFTNGIWSKLKDMDIPLTESLVKQSTYIDIQFPTYGKTYRYNVIKPLKATEYYQRIYWRNSYGGISFFDFTGQRSETRNLELSVYQKNIYDYYSSPMNELDKIYNNDVEYQVTIKSHLFDRDGRWLFNDMIQSPEVWTTSNGEKYAILLDNVSVDEVETNDIYEATVRFKYSMKPSII